MSNPVNRSAGATLGLALFAAAAFAPTATAQNERPLAIKNARILTLAGDPIENGTILVRDGKIAEIGTDVKIPPGTEVVDAAGGTIMPGLVNAWSHAGVSGGSGSTRSVRVPERFRRRFGNPSSAGRAPINKPSAKVADSLYARQEIFGELLAAGVTTLAIAPTGIGVPGLGAVIDPSKPTETDFVIDDDVYVAIRSDSKTRAKATLKQAMETAKKALEERNKPAEKKAEEKPGDKKSGDKEAEAKKGEKPADKGEEKPKPEDEPKPGDDPKPTPKDDPKPEEDPKPGDKPAGQDPKAGDDKAKADAKKPEKKKNPDHEVLADLLEGKRRAFVQLDSSAQTLHFLDAVKDQRFPTVIVNPSHDAWEGSLDQVAEQLGELNATILTTASLSSTPYEEAIFDPSARLRAAGLEVGYLIGDSQSSVRALFFQLMELVRCGADAQDVLRGVTVIPAKALGLDREVGTLEKGKRADFLMFDGDPLTPTTRMTHVYYRGARVGAEASR